MRKDKREKLEAKGWKVGSVQEFLGLSPEEAVYVELKVSLSRYLRERRNELGLTQSEVAERMGSSQSRVAKIEAADPSVSLDLLVRALLSLGTSTKELAEAITSPAA